MAWNIRRLADRGGVKRGHGRCHGNRGCRARTRVKGSMWSRREERGGLEGGQVGCFDRGSGYRVRMRYTRRRRGKGGIPIFVLGNQENLVGTNRSWMTGVSRMTNRSYTECY